jgi:hypothetical protein
VNFELQSLRRLESVAEAVGAVGAVYETSRRVASIADLLGGLEWFMVVITPTRL